MYFEIYSAEKLNFVEFNITGSGESLQRIDRGSLFLDTPIFNIFIDCFEKSNNLYDYIGPNKYNYRNFVILLNELNESLSALEAIDSIRDFEKFISSKFSGAQFIKDLELYDLNWKSFWTLYLHKLVDINKQLIGLVNKCMEQERVLWLVGY